MTAREPQLSRFVHGLIALVIVVAASLLGWFRPNPFDEPLPLSRPSSLSPATWPRRSPVRIAGVEVGKVVERQGA